MNNNAYELVKIMSNKKELKKDLQDIRNVIINIIQDKYISKVNMCIESQNLKTKKEFSKEMELINAFRNFVNEKEKIKIDKLIDTFIIINSINKIKKDVEYIKEDSLDKSNEVDSSEHPDGVYDIDLDCFRNINVSSIGYILLGLAVMSI